MNNSPLISGLIRNGCWQRLINVSNALAPAMSAHYGAGRFGGVLTLYEPRPSICGFIQGVVGNPDPHNIHRCYSLSIEKPMRGHRLGAWCSSVADRDPDLEQYGGAFLIPNLPLWASFSGWMEHQDILFLLYVMKRAEFLRQDDVYQIMRWHEGLKDLLMASWENFEDTFEAVPA